MGPNIFYWPQAKHSRNIQPKYASTESFSWILAIGLASLSLALTQSQLVLTIIGLILFNQPDESLFSHNGESMIFQECPWRILKDFRKSWTTSEASSGKFEYLQWKNKQPIFLFSERRVGCREKESKIWEGQFQISWRMMQFCSNRSL